MCHEAFESFLINSHSKINEFSRFLTFLSCSKLIEGTIYGLIKWKGFVASIEILQLILLIALNSVINLAIWKIDTRLFSLYFSLHPEQKVKCKIYSTASQFKMFASFCFIADAKKNFLGKHISHKRFPRSLMFPLLTLISNHEKFRLCLKRTKISFNIDVRNSLWNLFARFS
jgi:hypothetical protein